MTTPLFRIGHIYAIRAKKEKHIFIGMYAGASNDKYHFSIVFDGKQKKVSVPRDRMFKAFDTTHIGGENDMVIV